MHRPKTDWLLRAQPSTGEGREETVRTTVYSLRSVAVILFSYDVQ